MDKLAREALLFDLYGSLLTPKQQQLWTLCYDEDLSLAEIATVAGISRQAVHDALKRAAEILGGYEDKLHLLAQQEQQEQARDLLNQSLAERDWHKVEQAVGLL